MLTTVQHTKFHNAGNFLAKTNATGTVNATAHLFHRDQRTYIFVEHYALFFLITRRSTAITHCEILQLTFATLITHRTIQRVINQEEFHYRLLCLHRFVAVRAHDHARCNRSRTSWQRLWRFFNLNQTHATVSRD